MSSSGDGNFRVYFELLICDVYLHACNFRIFKSFFLFVFRIFKSNHFYGCQLYIYQVGS